MLQPINHDRYSKMSTQDLKVNNFIFIFEVLSVGSPIFSANSKVEVVFFDSIHKGELNA